MASDKSQTTNPHTARHDAEVWRTLYERSQREVFKRQVIIEMLATQLAATREITAHD